MLEISSLAIRVESLEAETAKQRLDALAASGDRAERSAESLAAASSVANTSLGGVAASAERAGKAAETLASTGTQAGQGLASLSEQSRRADQGLTAAAAAGARATTATQALGIAGAKTTTESAALAVAAQRSATGIELMAAATARARANVEEVLPGFGALRQRADELQARAQALSGTLGTTAAATDGVSAAQARAGITTGSLSQGFSTLATRLASVVSVALLARQLQEFANAGRELSASLADVSAATDATGPGLLRLRENIIGLADGTRFAASEVATAFAAIAADGDGLAETPEQIERITTAAITLAQATGTALPQATETITALLRQFGAGSDDAQRFIDVLAKIGPTASEMQDAAAALGAVGPIASSLGISFAETAAALAVLDREGVEAGEAGAGLKQVFMDLENETDARLRPSVVGLEQALTNAAEAGHNFTGRAAAIGIKLAQNVDEFGAATQAISETGAATELAERRMSSLDAQLGIAGASVRTMKQRIGDELTPGMVQAAVAATSLARAFGDMADEGEESAQTFSVVGTAARVLGTAVYGVVSGIQAIGDALGATAAAAVAVASGDFGEAINILKAYGEEADRQSEKFSRTATAIFNGQPLPELKPPTSVADVPVNFSLAPLETSGFGGSLDGLDLGSFSVEGRVKDSVANFDQGEFNAIQQQKTKSLLDEVRQRHQSEAEANRAAADRDIRALEALTGLSADQERQRSGTILAIRADLAAKQAELDTRAAATSKRVADDAAKQAADTLRNQASARNFDATVSIQLATGDPIAQDKIREQQRLEQVRGQGQLLVQQGVKNQQDLDAQVAALSAQSAEAQTLRESDILRQRDARLIQLRAEGQANEFEAERQRLEASLLMRQEAIIREAGSVDAGLKLIGDIKERGLADIAKREEQAAERDRQLAARTRQEKLQNVASTMVGLANLIGAGTDKITGIQRAAALASVLINIPETASDAYKFGTKAGGPVLGAAWAALSVAAQVGYASQLGGGGGGASSGGGVPAASSSVQYAATGPGKTYTESTTGDAPDLATLKRSDRIEREQLVASVNAPASIPVDGGPIPVDRPTLVIDEPVWDLPALAINTPNITAAPASMRVETPDLQIPELPVQRVVSVDERRVTTSSVTAAAAPAPKPAPTVQVPAAPQQRTTVLQAPSLPSLSVAQPGDIRVLAPRLPSLSAPAPAPAPARDVSTEIRREVSETLSRSTEATQSTSRTDSTVTAASSKESVVTRLLSATETLVSRVEAQERVTVEERTSETIRARVDAEAQPGVTLARPAEVVQTQPAPAIPAGGPLGALEFDAPVLELTEPQWQLPALTVNTPSLTAQPASVTITTPTVIIPPVSPQRVAGQGSTPQSIRGSIGVEAPGDISLRAPALPALTVAAPRLPALEVANVPAAIGAETPDPLQFDSPTLELTEPTWSLPALEVNTPSVRIEQQRGADAVSSLAAPAAGPAAVVSPAVTVQSVRQQLQAPASVALPQPEGPGLPDFPEIPAPRFNLPAPAAGRPQISTNIRVEVINNTGVQAQADVRESAGPNGEQMVQIFLTSVARDIDQNGPVAQATARRFGLQQQLGYRG